VHTPEQFIRPCWQVRLQALFEQTVPGGQALLQAPQFCGSRFVSTHWPLQAISPAGQLDTHMPDLQT
jgi:hypothetical protein